MKFSKLLKGAVLSLACVGVVGGPAMADTPVAAKKSNAVTISDVALAQGGTLVGQLVDKQGRAIEGAVVSVKFGNRQIAKTVTNGKGLYRVKGLRGGVHQVQAGRQAQLYRFWSPNTAPPVAKATALTVLGDAGVVRGQIIDGGITEIITPVAAVTGAILAGVAASNSSDADDNSEAAKAAAEAAQAQAADNAAAIANLPTS